MSKRRVAIHLTSTGGFYGAERVIVELASYLRDREWDSHVVALEGAGAGQIVNRAVEAGVSAEAFVSSGRLDLLSIVKRLRSLLRRYPHAVVHSHGYKPDILLSLLRVPSRLICLSTCHGWYSRSRKERLLEMLNKRAVRGFDRVIAVSEVIERELIDHGVGVQRVSLVRNGIGALRASADARARIRHEMRVGAEEQAIVQIGRLGYPKRNDLLLEAVSSLPAALLPHIWLVGEGEHESMLRDLARQRGLEARVRFCGYRNDIPDILSAADVMAVTSDTEGMPITVLEAMAMRCAVVSTTVGAIPRVLRDRTDAWLVPPGDSAALASALAEALGRPGIAKARAESAYQQYRREYSRDSMGSRYLEIYESVWARRGWGST